MAKTNVPAGAKAGSGPSAKAAAERPSKGPKPGKPKRRPVEIGGRKGLDPTRYGDWERKGRCIDF